MKEQEKRQKLANSMRCIQAALDRVKPNETTRKLVDKSLGSSGSLDMEEVIHERRSVKWIRIRIDRDGEGKVSVRWQLGIGLRAQIEIRAFCIAKVSFTSELRQLLEGDDLAAIIKAVKPIELTEIKRRRSSSTSAEQPRGQA